MKLLTLILSLLLSLLSGSGRTAAVESVSAAAVVATAPASDPATAPALNNDMCITSAQGWSFSGSESGSAVSFRTTQSGRRTSQSTRTPSRLIRTGKIIDTRNFNPFLSAVFPKSDGAQSFFRYLYSICCLRL